MKIFLRPLYSKLNEGVGSCSLGCLERCRVSEVSNMEAPSGANCPLFSHQARTYERVRSSEVEIIFNKTATGGGKSLAATLPGLLDRDFQTIILYPTIELIIDQQEQMEKYSRNFTKANDLPIDSLYGAELARRVELSETRRKYHQLLVSLETSSLILTNPDIFHYISHLSYYNPAHALELLPSILACYPDLYVCDEFHIFGVHQETAILNSLLFIRHSRSKDSPLKVLFTSATPKPTFIEQLRTAGFRVDEIAEEYASEPRDGYRQINQKVELNFIELDGEGTIGWLTRESVMIGEILRGENCGRGLIILNSVAKAGLAIRRLQQLLPDITILEVSGQIDHQERKKTREKLKNVTGPVLVVGTSAVDVGVDFKIHLLIFEISDAATFIQRLGRLGRHPGFQEYRAFALVPQEMRWVIPRLRGYASEEEEIDRTRFREEIIEKVLSNRPEREEYRQYWGALQAGGLLARIEGSSLKNKRDRSNLQQKTSILRKRIIDSLRSVYGEQMNKKQWNDLEKLPCGQAVQEELLRFRGGSDLQVAVWEEKQEKDEQKRRFYTYDLLRILPYKEVQIITREEFLEEAKKCQRSEVEFDKRYIQMYVRVIEPLDSYRPIELMIDRGNDELTSCTLTMLKGIMLKGDLDTALKKGIKKLSLLAFLIPLHKPQQLWSIRESLSLSATFGIYPLQDADERYHACAFNQDALLLESLKKSYPISRCQNSKPYIR
jgi:CRISPR-associated endonuclease/helicase Cas3